MPKPGIIKSQKHHIPSMWCFYQVFWRKLILLYDEIVLYTEEKIHQTFAILLFKVAIIEIQSFLW